MPKFRLVGLGIAKAALAMAAVVSVPCCLHASTILLRNTVPNDTRTPQLMPGSASLRAATAALRMTSANSRSQRNASFGDNNALAAFAASPIAFGTDQSLQFSIDVAPSKTPASDGRTVGVVLFHAADTRRVVRPASTSLTRYETIDGTERMEKHEEIMNTERELRLRFGSSDDPAAMVINDGPSESGPEPSTFALMGFGLLLLMARAVRGRCS